VCVNWAFVMLSERHPPTTDKRIDGGTDRVDWSPT
jgi:hypothetical protein